VKVLKWLKTEKEYLAVFFPEELFVENSFYEAGKHNSESIIEGILKNGGEPLLYAYAFDKSIPFSYAKSIVSSIPNYIGELQAEILPEKTNEHMEENKCQHNYWKDNRLQMK